MLLRTDEVAGVLQVPRARVYELINKGSLPCVRLGRQVRVDREALLAWIRAGGCPLPVLSAGGTTR